MHQNNKIILSKVEVISLLKNVGHARSIATGLKYIYEKEDFDYVIPMDGDGEDRPDEISKFTESEMLQVLYNNPKKWNIMENLEVWWNLYKHYIHW